MRKATKQIGQAFIDGDSLKIKNDATGGPDGTINITLAGYNTVTTRERLNGLLSLLGYDMGFGTKEGQVYFGETPIDSSQVISLKGNNTFSFVH